MDFKKNSRISENTRKIKTVLTVLLIGGTFFIWGNSLWSMEQSGAMSGHLKQKMELLLQAIHPSDVDLYVLVRKNDHVFECAVLSVLWSVLTGRKYQKWVILPGVITALVDEGIQLFHAERTGCLLDVGIDLTGVVLGMGVCLLFNYLTQTSHLDSAVFECRNSL